MNSGEKGFVISFAAILLVSVVLLFALYYADKNFKEEKAITENLKVMLAGFVADDVASDVQKIVGASVEINQRDANTLIKVNDRLPGKINKTELSYLEDFLEDDYNSMQNCFLDVNFEELIDGKSELIFSNGLQYDYNSEGDPEMIFYNPGSDAGVLAYDINIHVTGNLQSSTAWSYASGGDIYINLHYTDSHDNEITESGSLDSSLNNQYTLNYSGGVSQILINVGIFNGNSKALKITESVLAANVKATVDLGTTIASPSDELTWHYNADLNYSTEDVNVNKQVGFY